MLIVRRFNYRCAAQVDKCVFIARWAHELARRDTNPPGDGTVGYVEDGLDVTSRATPDTEPPRMILRIDSLIYAGDEKVFSAQVTNYMDQNFGFTEKAALHQNSFIKEGPWVDQLMRAVEQLPRAKCRILSAHQP